MTFPPKRRALYEIVAIVTTGAVFLVYENVLRAPKLPFLIACSLGWGAYLLMRLRQDRTLLKDWGLHPTTFWPAARSAGLLTLVVAALILAYRVASGWTGLPARALVVLALYPLWGLVQQFGAQALVAGNLAKLGVSRPVVVAVAAVLFGVVHLPDWTLAALCTVAGVAWTTIFLRTPHLVPLAICHAILGTLTYYWILGRDPWLEMLPPT